MFLLVVVPLLPQMELELVCATPRRGCDIPLSQPHGVIALSLITGPFNPCISERHRASSTMPYRKWLDSEPQDDENAAVGVLPR
jgi:hypothetical protein